MAVVVPFVGVATALAACIGLGCAPSPGPVPSPVPTEGAEAELDPHEASGTATTPPVPGTYSLPPLGDAADGAVLESDGSPTTLHALFEGRLVLLSFIYGGCTDARGCPLALGVLDGVQQRVRDDAELAGRVRILSLSFDPERDTPAVMGRYEQDFVPADDQHDHDEHGHDEHGHDEHAHGAHDVDWRFLTTASSDALEPILDAYGQALTPEIDQAGEPTGAISHVLRVFLIDTDRRIRNVYSSSFLQPDTLLADLHTLAREEGGALADSEVPTPTASALALRGPGDVRQGYESGDFATRTVDLASRRGRPADLTARLAQAPLGLPPVPVPEDAPVTRERVQLGRRLFYDRRLSHNDTFSCAMCHIPEQGFTNNELATAVGIEGRTVRRNAPTLYNAAYVEHLFHDGRETRLEHQIWGPLLARNEMGNPSVGSVIEKIRSLPGYSEAFDVAFPGRGLAIETVGMALAAYERTLVSGDSAFDRWHFGGDAEALESAARRGFALFVGRGGCLGCHSIGTQSALFSDGRFHNTGVGYAASLGLEPGPPRVQVSPGVFLEVDAAVVATVSEPRPGDLGRYEITGDPADRWKYRTPSLRNVALTAPYMHDGSLPTLHDVVRFYDRGGVPNDGLDPRIRPLGLDADEVADLVAFLESLTGADVPLLVADAFAAPVGDVGTR